MRTLEAAENGERLGLREIVCLLSSEEEEKQILFQTADRVRRTGVGEEIHLRGIVEFSNVCVQNCLYCGLRKGNEALHRYRMSPAEIVRAAEKVKALNFGTIVLQSGEDPWFTRERVSDLIREIKGKTGLIITLAVGERPYEDYRAWREAGADRYLLKQETCSSPLYEKLRPGKRLEERLQCLRWLKDLGYQAGTGNMVGLPGQGLEDIARDILFFRDFDCDMAGIGPFIPHPHTPLREAAGGTVELTLKVLALTRILTPEANLPATTAVGTLSPDGRKRALEAGANVVMPDLTPWEYRRHYEIYPGKVRPSGSSEWFQEIALPPGRIWSYGPGHRVRKR